jgi:cytochrome c-type biogenesis protein
MAQLGLPVGLAFLAGMASFLSPCVLSLVPAYVGYLGGRAAGRANGQPSRLETCLHGLAFVVGFSLVFILFGVLASALGDLQILRPWIGRLGGLVVMLFGLHMIGVLHLPFLDYDVRIHSQPNQRLGYLASLLLGIIFSAGWSPCIGPILTAVLAMAASSSSVLQGLLLGLFYSAGLAVPFLVAALGIGWVILLLKRYKRALRIIEIAMGVVLILVGALLLLGQFSLIASLMPGVSFGL